MPADLIPFDECICGSTRRTPKSNCWATKHDFEYPTREQDETVERLTLEHGRVHVGAAHFEDGAVEVTVPNGTSWHMTRSGQLRPAPFNHSVDWTVE